MVFMKDKIVMQLKREIITSPRMKKKTRSKFSNKIMKNVIKKKTKTRKKKKTVMKCVEN